MPPKRIALWAGTCLGLVFILALLLRYDPKAVFLPLLQSKLHLLITVMGILATAQLLNALTPVVLLGVPNHVHLSWWSRTRVFLAMQPLSLIAPGRLSDFGAVPLLSKHYSPGALASSIVLDRLVTLFFLLLVTPLALRLAWPIRASGLADLAVVVGLILVASAPFLLSSRKVRSVVNRYFLRLWPSLLQGFGAHTAFILRTSKVRLLLNLGLTVIKTLLSAVALVLLASNVGLSLNVLTAIWMSILIQLATSIPVSVQGIGVAEGSLVLLFSVNELPEALALSVSVTARILLAIVTVGIYLTTTVPVISERLEKK